VQSAPDGRLAQRHVVRLGAGEVLKHVAELVRLDDLQVDLHAGVRGRARPHVAALVQGLDDRQLRQRGGERRRLGAGGDDVDVLDRIGHPAHRPGRLDAVGGRVRPQRLEDLVRRLERA
jgi:hypothetical protein